MASSCWLHCRLRMCRGRGRGCDAGFMEAEVVEGARKGVLRVHAGFTLG